MPRKFWKQKNRYCWNSNLSEEVFLLLLRLYCMGSTCSYAARVVERCCRRFGGTKVSRQTVNRYFLMFGDYLYEMLPDRHKPERFTLELGDDAPADPEQRQLMAAAHVLGGIYLALYEKLDHTDPVNQIIIHRGTVAIHDYLKACSRDRRGYPVHTFSAHFALCAWFFLAQSLRTNEAFHKALYGLLKATLEDQPLDPRHNRSLRFSKPENPTLLGNPRIPPTRRTFLTKA